VSLEGTAAVVLHPHPSMGGDSSHPFVVEVATRLAALGVNVATPDLRDPDVAKSAPMVQALMETMGGERKILVGYSWGSIVVSHANPSGLAARVLVAPPAQMALGSNTADVPLLVLVPENDQYGDLDTTRATFGDRVEVIPGADHFLWGAIDSIGQRVVDWLALL
jgi:alpha/beta superfamily hydrolase